MQKIIQHKRNRFLINPWLICPGVLLFIASCTKPPEPGTKYWYQYLVSSTPGHPAKRIDANFINGWGLAFGPSGVAWISAANAGLSEVWNKDGNEVIPGGVTIPSRSDTAKGGAPSGQLFNGTSDFKLPNGNPAVFVFAGLDGVISGWNGGPAAKVAVNSAKAGAAYTGIAIGQNAGNNFIYASDFANRKIVVFNKNWVEVQMPFKDPGLPDGYSPFNIQNIQGKLFVMYAKVAKDGDEQKGDGLGFVDVYNPDGSLLARFASNGTLNAPWGITVAPKGFWGDKDADDEEGIILVGNFGDGRINAFSKFGLPLGQLKKEGKALVIKGLWGIAFPPATAVTLDPNRLYFAAGPDDETNGVFGYFKNDTPQEGD